MISWASSKDWKDMNNEAHVIEAEVCKENEED